MQEKGHINFPIEFMRVAGVILITFTHIRHDYTNGLPFFILETLPTYGTLLLSVISGYLFFNYRHSTTLLQKKVKSLLIPYLIANLVVIVPVFIINALGYNYLNRLQYDHTLITEGLFALHSPPINPPTYFIRDLFVIFCFLAILKKDYRGLVFIVPLLLFGKVLLRAEIAVLFLAGFCINKYKIDKLPLLYVNLVAIPLVCASFFVLTEYQLYKDAIALLFFINFMNIRITFFQTGAYTYLLHLYHSPVIVFLFPLIHLFHLPAYAEAALQIVFAIALCYILYRIMKKFSLGFIAGNRV